VTSISVSRYQGSESKPTAAIFVPDESEISYGHP